VLVSVKPDRPDYAGTTFALGGGVKAAAS